MKTTIKTFVVFLLVIIMATASGVSAAQYAREMQTATFHKLVADGNVHLVFVSNEDGKIRVEGNSASVASLSISQKNGELSISKEELPNEGQVTVYVPVSEMNTLIVSGKVSVECETVIHANVFSLLHKGTGVVKLKSDAKVIQTLATKNGRIAVDGEYKNIVSRIDASNHLIVAYTK